VADDNSVYAIGGQTASMDTASSEVSVLDLRSNCWRDGPSLRVGRVGTQAISIDGDIYVVGGTDREKKTRESETLGKGQSAWEVLSGEASAETRAFHGLAKIQLA